MRKMHMKKIFLMIVIIIFVISIGICIQYQALGDKEKELKWSSDTLPKDCKLCGNKEDTQISWYEPQDNLGIISINTFELNYIEINRYDESGSLIEEAVTGIGTYGNGTSEDGFTSVVTVNTNRGYASGNIHMNQDKAIDPEKVSMNLCMECLDHIFNTAWGEPYSVGLINFKTGELMLFTESLRGFMLGDFYVLCEPRAEDGSREISDIDLHIFYCPERY